jgi:hypothetical protein
MAASDGVAMEPLLTVAQERGKAESALKGVHGRGGRGDPPGQAELA